MDSVVRNKIQETVMEILRSSDWEKTSLRDVRKAASEKLNMDLSEPDNKKLVKEIVASYIQEKEAEVKEGDVKHDDDDEEKVESGDFLICKLTKNRRVTTTEYQGKKYLSIRDFYLKNGQYLPTKRGINLSLEDWKIFNKNIPAIEKAMMPKKD